MARVRRTWAALIPAAGSSRRMDGAEKEFLDLDGMPVLAHSYLLFSAIPEVVSVVLVVRPPAEQQARAILARFSDAKPPIIVGGGASRQASVLNGLSVLAPLRPDYVLIHDGARPWVSRALVARVMSETERRGACIPVIPSTEALKRIGACGECIEHLDRSTLFRAQTPQAFRFRDILDAHRAVAGEEKTYSDDAEIAARMGLAVYTVKGEPANRKITFPHDVAPHGTRR